MNQVELEQQIPDWIKHRAPFLITGEPGCAKTEIVIAVCDKLYGPPVEQDIDGFKELDRPYYHPEHAVLDDPSDVSGVQFVNPGAGTLDRAKPEWCQQMRAREGLIFMDELGQGAGLTQAALMRLVRERQIALHKMRPGWALGAATNEAQHRAGAGQLNRALLGRFDVRVDLTVDPQQYREYTLRTNYDFKISSYLAWQPQDTQAYDPEKKSSPTCRGWGQINKALRFTHQPLEIFAGILGDGVGTKFAAFCRLQEEVTPPDEIVRNPDKVKIPKEVDLRYATVGALVEFLKAKFDADKLGRAITYGKRLPAEFGMLLARDLLRDHTGKLLALPAMRGWISENNHILV